MNLITNYNYKIDFLKAIAIISVILLHSLPRNVLLLIQAQFYIWQAVPIFIFLLGYNWGKSYLKNPNMILFLRNRLKRLLIPLIIFSILSLVFIKNWHFDYALFLGVHPFRGPGTYFIALLLQFLIIVPLVVIVYKNIKPLCFLVIFFLFNILIDFFAIYIFDSLPSIYYSSFSLRYIFMIALGIYYINHEDSFFSHILTKIGFLISIAYLTYWGYSEFYPMFMINLSGWQHVYAYFYTAFLVYFIMKMLPNIFKMYFKYFLIIGQASLHIFLLQILFFGINGMQKTLSFIEYLGFTNIFTIHLLSIFCMLFINILGGLIWFKLEKKLYWRKNETKRVI